jgi:hypothetical protein
VLFGRAVVEGEQQPSGGGVVGRLAAPIVRRRANVTMAEDAVREQHIGAVQDGKAHREAGLCRHLAEEWCQRPELTSERLGDRQLVTADGVGGAVLLTDPLHHARRDQGGEQSVGGALRHAGPAAQVAESNRGVRLTQCRVQRKGLVDRSGEDRHGHRRHPFLGSWWFIGAVQRRRGRRLDACVK